MAPRELAPTHCIADGKISDTHASYCKGIRVGNMNFTSQCFINSVKRACGIQVASLRSSIFTRSLSLHSSVI
jgi:hypothetical protein